MPKIIEKVTAFVTHKTSNAFEILLLEHPHVGNQFPAGTVEPGESPVDAAIREVCEETGLTGVKVVSLLGVEDEKLPENTGVIIPPATIYSRPDRSSFDWINIRSAIEVEIGQSIGGFSQITYIEHDQIPDPNYISMQITGWIPAEFLAKTRRRHFFHLEFKGQSQERWTIFSDHHIFSPFWVPLANLPKISSPQDTWVGYLKNISKP